MQYQRFDPAPFGFPRPRVPLLPAPSLESFSAFKQAAAVALLDDPGAHFFSRGRYALAEAFRRCGIGPQSTVLAPAYHCRSMLDPALRLGAEVALYPLKADLHIDLDGLAKQAEQCSQPATVLLVTHYFGFPQPMQDLLAWCKDKRITLIEDCSHCLFLPSVSGDLGQLGSYCVSSPYKFFPVEDGGILWTNGRARPTSAQTRQTRQTGIADELRGVVHALKRGLSAHQTPSPAPARHAADTSDANLPAQNTDRLEDSSGPSHQYTTSVEHHNALAISRWGMRHTKVRRLIAQRRSNYLEWVRCVAVLSHCRALHPVLPTACVPYMFPLLIDKPQAHFMALKRLGMPVWRWDDIAVSTCGVAARYRTQLLHLPCHQELTPAQMVWMTNTLTDVLQQQPHREAA